MKRKSVFAAVAIMMLLTNYILGSDSTLVNGSFEADGIISTLNETHPPTGWADVNLPINKFGGWVDNDWVTNGNWNLTVFARQQVTFNINDKARVAQYVYLTDVNAIWFDLKLETNNKPWDPNKCTTVLEIDNMSVWESPNDKADVRGEYRNRMYSVGPMYNNNGLHKLALILRINIAGSWLTTHYAEWDNIRFSYACDGYGYPTGDFNHDCAVDFLDYAVLAGEWLNETDPCAPNLMCDLYKGDESEPYGVINFRDFAVYAEDWDCNTAEFGNFAEVWLQEVDANNPYNLFHGDDVGPIGIIDSADLAIFGENWLKPLP